MVRLDRGGGADDLAHRARCGARGAVPPGGPLGGAVGGDDLEVAVLGDLHQAVRRDHRQARPVGDDLGGPAAVGGECGEAGGGEHQAGGASGAGDHAEVGHPVAQHGGRVGGGGDHDDAAGHRAQRPDGGGQFVLPGGGRRDDEVRADRPQFGPDDGRGADLRPGDGGHPGGRVGAVRAGGQLGCRAAPPAEPATGCVGRHRVAGGAAAAGRTHRRGKRAGLGRGFSRPVAWAG